MAYTPTIQQNIVKLQHLGRVTEAAKDVLFDASNALGRVRDIKGKVPVTNPHMAAAVAQVQRAQGILSENAGGFSGLPQATEVASWMAKGEKGMARALRLVAATTIDPSALDRALPTYEFQEAALSASQDVRDLREGLNSLATGIAVTTLPKSVPDARLDRFARNLTALSGQADGSYRSLQQAGAIAGEVLEREVKQHPNATDIVVDRYLLDGWGVTPLARKAVSSLPQQWDLKVPPGADSQHVREHVGDKLQGIGQVPTDPVDESRVSLKAVVRSLDDAAHQAAVHRNEAGSEAEQMRLLKLYGRRSS